MGEGGHVPFLERTGGLRAAPGPIEDAAGRLLGTHRGHWRFTVGQRRGIGLASPEPLYVLRTDAARNAVVVGPREALAERTVELGDARVHGGLGDGPLEVRLRYRGRPLRGRVVDDGPGVRIALDDPADGVAPGQTAALYRDGRLVAAGTIAHSPTTADAHRRTGGLV